MRKFFTLLLGCLICFTALKAHVGSSGVVMQGNAGPYKLLVNITPPDVIPGIAKVDVYLQNAVGSVTLRPIYFRTGDEGAPEPDEMKAATGRPGRYNADVWMMSGGSSGMEIKVKGALGEGEMIVPVVAIATANKDLPPATGYLLAIMGIFLFVLMITIISASVSDGITKAGEGLSAKGMRVRNRGIITAAIIIVLLLGGGRYWLISFADDYAQYKYQPTQAVSSIAAVGGRNELQIALDTSEAAQRKTLYAYLVPDHGKLMHLFAVRLPAMDAFAHLHPIRVDENHFRTILPNLPKGKYLLFADIVYVSGFTETIKDTFDISVNHTVTLQKLDPDDAHAFAIPNDLVDNPQLVNPAETIICGKPGTGVKLKDGSTMVWEGMSSEPFEAGQLYNLSFAVLAPDKQPATLQPYMGMSGHAAIMRSDGNVYMHLHPMGTTSMAAEQNFEKRMTDSPGEYQYPEPTIFKDSVDGYTKHLSGLSNAAKDSLLMVQMKMPPMTNDSVKGMVHTNMVEFPYSFPSPGQYRVWVQVKRNGQVLTAAFDKIVR